MSLFSWIVRRERDFLIEFVDPAIATSLKVPGIHLSLRSCWTAMLAGLRTLIQTRHGPDL
jgi:hypothetical protein